MEISELRQKIDQIDDKIIELFSQRMNTVLEVSRYKKDNQVAVLDRQRERDVLQRVTGMVDPNLEIYTKILYETLFALSRSYQCVSLGACSSLADSIRRAIDTTPQLFPTKAVVACQGVEGAYSQIACDKLFSLPKIMYFQNFDSVFKAVESNLCKYGILPIENSSHGSVTQVYDLMKQHQFHIVRSMRLKVNHFLLAKPGTVMSDIKEIFSHQQALGQCSEYLEQLKGVKVTVCENTAMAAQMVAESPRRDIAAISSNNCAELYGLSVLNNDIQNSDNNYTRFICISKEMEIYPGANKISLMLSIPHRPGSLYDLIARFSALNLNLTKLESRPIPGRDFEFMFYFDIEASVYNDAVIKLLCALDAELDEFVFLGSYSES